MKRKLLILSLMLVAMATQVWAQERTVSGKVTSAEDGSGLPGVNIIIKGTTTGAVTDIEGNYRISVPQSGAVLEFRAIGLLTQEIEVGSRSVIDVQLKPDVKELAEVIVSGYAPVAKKDLTTAVSVVSSESIKDIPYNGIDQALQGQTPGVMVTSSSGTPGGGIMIRVRGNNSITSSNRPLFIVDGIPLEDGTLSQRSFGGQNDNALASLNPNDIESYQVLKDAAAKAIYGSRAANGVILVTTKRGKKGERTSINLDVQRGIIDPTKRQEVLNSKQLLELHRETYANAGQNPDLAGIPGIKDAVDTDWQDEIFRRAIMSQYQLSARGGTERTTFYISGGYRNEEGVQLNNSFERYTGTFNIENKASDKLTIGANASLARTINNRIKGDNFLDGVYSGALSSLPWYQPYDENGELYSPRNGGTLYGGFPHFNPVGQAVLPRFIQTNSKFVGGLSAEYKILTNLSLRSKVSADYNLVHEDQFEPTTTAIGGFLANNGYGVDATSEVYTYVNSNTLSYNVTLGDKHNVSALLGTEFLQRTFTTSSVTGNNYPSNELNYISSAGTIVGGGSLMVKNGLTSYFADFKYNYAEKYYFSATLRRDGSSRFGDNKKYGVFPAFSAAYRISDESFMENVSFISDLKIRASYGVTGNERIADFAYLGTWAAAAYAYNGQAAILPNNISNPDLGWEQTDEFNFGLDLSLFTGRIQLGADVYRSQTNDLLLAAPLAGTTGFNSVTSNIGSVSNSGVELGITSFNLDGDFKWSTTLNVSRNRNLVEELATDEPINTGYISSGVGATHTVRKGEPLGTFWGLKFLGVDPATGNAIYEDIDNSGTITAEDAQVIGNAQADLFGGITNNFSYKGIEVNVFFQYSLGNQMINYTKQDLLNSGQSLTDNQSIEALERWRQPGDITDVPVYILGNTYNSYYSSRFVEDASYLRLKNLTIAYNLPSELVSRAKLQNVRVLVSGTNLLTLTKYSGPDPEVNSNDGSTTQQGLDLYTLPQVRTLSLGLNIGF